MVMQDASLVSISPLGNLVFVRREGLASMQMLQMISMGAYKDKYDAHRLAYSGNMFNPPLLVQKFVSHNKGHVSLLYSLVLAVTDFRLSGASEDNLGVVVRDKFGLRKVVVTKQGMMYGLDWTARLGTFYCRRCSLVW